MAKGLKLSLTLLGTLLALAALTLVIIVTLLDPNDYKATISHYAKEYTGRSLTINGNLGWSFFPRLGLTVKDATLSNTSTFGDTPFMTVKTANFKLQLLPLLSGQVKTDTLNLSGLTVNLQRDGQGNSNWHDFLQPSPTTPPHNASKQQPSAPAKTTQQPSENLVIRKINIKDSHINFTDKQAPKQFSVGFNLTLQNIGVSSAIPITTNITFHDKIADLTVKGSLEGSLLLDTKQHQYGLRQTTWKAHVQPKAGTSAASTLSGDTDMVLTLPSDFADNTPKLWSLPLPLLRNVTLKTSLKADAVAINTLRITNVSLTANADKGQLHITPLQGALYGGTFSDKVTLDVRDDVPKWHVRESVKRVNLGPLLKQGLQVDEWATGNLAVVTDVRAQGSDIDAMLKSASGVVSIVVKDGTLRGIDIKHTVKLAKSLLKDPKSLLHQLPDIASPTQSSRTAFSELSSSMLLDKGVAHNEGLRLISEALIATAKGDYNLHTRAMDFRILAREAKTVTENGKTSYQPKGEGIPIRVTGTFNKPQFALDSIALRQLALKHVSKNLGKRLKKTLGDGPLKELQKTFGGFLPN